MESTLRTYQENQDITAPSDVPEVGIHAGDRGVVLVAFDRPQPALEVEFLNTDGEPGGPCVIYSPDLRTVYSHHSGYST